MRFFSPPSDGRWRFCSAKEGELSEKSVVKEYLTTATDGRSYKTSFYIRSSKKFLAHAVREMGCNGAIFGIEP